MHVAFPGVPRVCPPDLWLSRRRWRDHVVRLDSQKTNASGGFHEENKPFGNISILQAGTDSPDDLDYFAEIAYVTEGMDDASIVGSGSLGSVPKT